MLTTGICHTDKTMPCPRCRSRIPLDAQRCPVCNVNILIIRKRRKKKDRTEQQ